MTDDHLPGDLVEVDSKADGGHEFGTTGRVVRPSGSTVVVYSVLTTTSVGAIETVTYLQFENGSMTVLESKWLL